MRAHSYSIEGPASGPADNAPQRFQIGHFASIGIDSRVSTNRIERTDRENGWNCRTNSRGTSAPSVEASCRSHGDGATATRRSWLAGTVGAASEIAWGTASRLAWTGQRRLRRRQMTLVRGVCGWPMLKARSIDQRSEEVFDEPKISRIRRKR